MNTPKANYRLVVRIHQIIILITVLSYLFLNKALQKISLTILAVAAISLVIQVFIYSIKPDAFGDKTKEHPHEL